MNSKVVFFSWPTRFSWGNTQLLGICEMLNSTKLGPFTWFSPLRRTTVLHIVLASVTVNIYSPHFRNLPSSGDTQRFGFQAGISTAKKPPSGTGLPDGRELCGWWMWEQQIQGPVAVERQGRLFQMLIFFFSCLHFNCYFFSLVHLYVSTMPQWDYKLNFSFMPQAMTRIFSQSKFL